ncbi:MAG: hypothetical protein H7Z75_19045 [Ferruginibacter sp.]|nr:hypothetical protein [Cytophagales bacterium]
MKTSTIVLVTLLLAAWRANAQEIAKIRYRYNPAYSIHNYKHPDKADLARKYRIGQMPVIQFVEKFSGSGTANYKQPFSSRGRRSTRPITLPSDYPRTPNRANYKQQNVVIP